MAIGMTHLHHGIAGSLQVLAGLFVDPGVAAAADGRFLLRATLGNVLGGVIFASLKYSHAVRARPSATSR